MNQYVQLALKSGKSPREVAVEMAESGFTKTEIARQLEVGRTTVYRWLEDQAHELERVVNRSPEWPDDREWKSSWTSDKYREVGLQDEPAETHFGVVIAAQHTGNRYALWYERRWVDHREKYQSVSELLDPTGPGPHWLDAMAALPVLCEWLGGSDACGQILNRINKYEPWAAREYSKRIAYSSGRVGRLVQGLAGSDPEVKKLIGYSSSVRTHAEQLRLLIGRQSVARATLPPVVAMGIPLPTALNALMERIPHFDRVPAKTRYKPISSYYPWRLFTAIFAHHPLSVSAGESK